MRYNWGRQPQENIHDIKHGQDQGVGEHKLAAFVAQLGLQVLVDILGRHHIFQLHASRNLCVLRACQVGL